MKQQARAEVRETIAEVLDRLPAAYSKELFDVKCEITYRHIYSSYQGANQSVYSVL